MRKGMRIGRDLCENSCLGRESVSARCVGVCVGVCVCVCARCVRGVCMRVRTRGVCVCGETHAFLR